MYSPILLYCNSFKNEILLYVKIVLSKTEGAMFIKNATVITFDDQERIIENGGVLIDNDGKIAKVGCVKDIEPFLVHDEEIIDAKGKLLMPGNICAHTHFYGVYSRGLYIPGDAPNAFPQILEKLWWKLDKSLDEESSYFSALICLIDAIKHGTTTLFDHHASPNFINNSLDTLAKAVLESGLRASLSYEVTDRDGQVKAHEGIEENLRFIEKTKNGNNSFLSSTFGLHASLTLSDETLKMAREKCPNEIGFHIHAAEHIVDEYDSIKKSGLRVVNRLEKFGILGPKTIIAHGVHLDVNEVNHLVDSETWLTHQPRSNMNNAVGLPDVESMLNAGVKYCLGNDGFSNSMWAEWNSAYLAHKLNTGDPRKMPASVIQKMAIANNRALTKIQFNGLDVGKIDEGCEADLIIVDYHPITDLNKDNLAWQIVFGFRDGMVNSTIVGGELLMHDRKILNLDEEAILKEAKKVSVGVWKRYHDSFL
jgi:putative selenium metabolism protein SsnA